MKLPRMFCARALFVCVAGWASCAIPSINAGIVVDNVDGTSTVTVVDAWIPGSNGNFARGFAQILGGITLASGNINPIKTHIPVQGDISLNGGTLELEEDLVFSGSTFAITSGRITVTAEGHTLFLTNDQRIGSSSTITFSNDAIIDGKGRRVELESGASLVVAVDSTLTLRNLTLENLSANRLVMQGRVSKLILDNCSLVLDGNYSLSQGALEIRNNCSIEGAYTFTLGTYNTHVSRNARLKVAGGATLDFIPTGSWRNGLRFENATSQLVLAEATFKNHNDFGAHFFNGHLIVEGNSVVDSTFTDSRRALVLGSGTDACADCKLTIRADAKLTVRNAGMILRNKATGSFNVHGELEVEPGGNVLIEEPVLGGDGTFNVGASLLGGKSVRTVSGIDSTPLTDAATTESALSVEWRPQGNSIAIGRSSTSGATSSELQWYVFSNAMFSSPVSASIDGPPGVESARWHPSGFYVGVVSGVVDAGMSAEIRVYSFAEPNSNGRITLDTGDPRVTSDVFVRACAWSPDGRHFAIGSDATVTGSELRLYRFKPDQTTEAARLVELEGVEISQGVLSLDWSHDGRFLAVGRANSGGDNETVVYAFDGTKLTLNGHGSVSADVHKVRFSPDGNFLLSVNSPISSPELRLWRWDPQRGLENGTSSLITPTTGADARVQYTVLPLTASWSPDGRFLVVGTAGNGGGDEVRFYRFDTSISGVLTELSGLEVGATVYASHWYPSGDFFAIGTDDSVTLPNTNELRAYGLTTNEFGARARFEDATIVLGQDMVLDRVQIGGS